MVDPNITKIHILASHSNIKGNFFRNMSLILKFILNFCKRTKLTSIKKIDLPNIENLGKLSC